MINFSLIYYQYTFYYLILSFLCGSGLQGGDKRFLFFHYLQVKLSVRSFSHAMRPSADHSYRLSVERPALSLEMHSVSPALLVFLHAQLEELSELFYVYAFCEGGYDMLCVWYPRWNPLTVGL